MPKKFHPRDLLATWDAPKGSKLSPKQRTIRLPIEVEAKLEALMRLKSLKNRNEVIGEILAAALLDIEGGISGEPNEEVVDVVEGEPEFMPSDSDYQLYRKYYHENLEKLEAELEGDNKND